MIVLPGPPGEHEDAADCWVNEAARWSRRRGFLRVGSRMKCEYPQESKDGFNILTLNSWWFLIQVAIGCTAFVMMWMYFTVQFFQNLQDEKIKRYDIGTLKAPEDVQIMERPSIKVRIFNQTLLDFGIDNGRLLVQQLYNVMRLRLDNF